MGKVSIGSLNPPASKGVYRLHGVFSNTDYRLVGFIEQRQRGGFWYVVDTNGKRVGEISQCRTFGYAKSCALAHTWEV